MKCPRCLKNELHPDPPMNALSRKGSVYICEDCGMEEAFLDAGLAYITDEMIENDVRIEKYIKEQERQPCQELTTQIKK